MSVNDLYLFPDVNVTKNWNVADHRRQYALIVEHFDWQIIHLQSICHVANSLAISIRVSDDDDFVTELEETLREIENVLFDSTVIGKKEVGGDAETVEKRFHYCVRLLGLG